MDDLEEMQWVNVQDPVRQMITSITKAVRTQSAGIRDLDRKIGLMASTDSVHSIVEDVMARAFQKQDGIMLAETIASKADGHVISALESGLQQVSNQLSRLSEVLQDQNSAIRDLNHRVTRLSDEVDDIRNPNYDKIFAYVDKQVQKLHTDVTDKLAVKADLREVERSVPQKVDEVYRAVMSEVKALQKEVSRSATKEEFQVLLASKADGAELRAVAADVSKNVTKAEMQQAISAQVRPVVTAISSLEKVIQIQEDRRPSAQTPVSVPKQPVWNYDKIQRVVEDVIQQRYPHINEAVTNRSLETSLAQNKEFLLHEMGSQTESIRLELAAAQRESIGHVRKRVDDKVQELAGAVREARDSTSKTKSGLKELASNMAKALAKKADRSEMRKLTKEDRENHHHSTGPVHGYSDHHDTTLTSILHGNQHGASTALGAGYAGSTSSGVGMSPVALNALTADMVSVRRELGTAISNFHDNKAELDRLRMELTEEVAVLRERLSAAQQHASRARSSTVTEDSPPSPSTPIPTTHRRSKSSSSSSSSGGQRRQGAGGGGVGSSFTEWRMALGDLSLNMRRELSEKCSREEMHAAIGAEMGGVDKRLAVLTRDVSAKADTEDISKFENALVDLRSKVAGELTGGRWLWTNGKISKDGWVPWDTEVQNAAPAMLLWRAGSTTITARIPGLYKLTAAVFTSLPSALQICLNGEPILSLQPDLGDSTSSSNSQALKEERYVIRRLRHSVGEVTCLCVEEHVSLPADAELTIRFHSAASAQGFFAIKKL